MTDKQVERWAATRAKGRQRYIWAYWVFAWGLGVGVAWPFAMAAIQGWDRLPILMPISLVGFPIGGFFAGAWVWKKAEAEYSKAMTAQTRVQEP
jgi:hypothetical protein